MICATCLAATDAVPCTHCGYDPRLGRLYSLERSLLGAPDTPTFLAEGPGGRRLVAEQVAQAMHVAYATWAAASQRLAALRAVEHRAIAAVVDVVEAGSGDLRSIWLLREYLPPPSLLIEARDRTYTEADVVGLMTELLDALARLDRRGGVAHGRVEAASIFRREDGSLALAGFLATSGPVRTDPSTGRTIPPPESGVPIVLPPHLAPERALEPPSAAADVYGVGMVALHLLGGAAATTARDARGRLEWAPPEGVRADLVALLTAMVDLDARGRPRDAATALERLGKLHPEAARRHAGLPRPPSAEEEAAPSPDHAATWAPEDRTSRPRAWGPVAIPAAFGVAFALVLGAIGSASASLQGGASESETLADAAATSAQAELAARVATSWQIRRCVDEWRKAHPDAPEDAPQLTVTILSTGTLIPATTRGAEHDLMTDLPGCTRDAVDSVDGPERPIATGGRRLFQVSLSLGSRWAESVTYTYRWEQR